MNVHTISTTKKFARQFFWDVQAETLNFPVSTAQISSSYHGHDMGVSKNNGTTKNRPFVKWFFREIPLKIGGQPPKWMVYNGNPY